MGLVCSSEPPSSQSHLLKGSAWIARGGVVDSNATSASLYVNTQLCFYIPQPPWYTLCISMLMATAPFRECLSGALYSEYAVETVFEL